MVKEQLKPEKRDRFDELMRARHENAMAGLKIEEALSYIDSSIIPDDYPTSRSPENLNIEKKAFVIAIDAFKSTYDKFPVDFQNEHLAKVNALQNAIHQYIIAKVRADRFQFELGKALDEKGIRKSGPEAGEFIFEKKTGSKPLGQQVTLNQNGGYMVMTFYDRRDYVKFTGIKGDKSGGRFCGIPTLGMEADFVLVPWEEENDEDMALRHERQHFINRTVLGVFEEVESTTFRDIQKLNKEEYPALSKMIERVDGSADRFMRGVKDELLACIRDGRFLLDVTDFWNDDMYYFLRESSLLSEQSDISQILRRVKEELDKGLGLFEGGQSDKLRGLLVYHLIDIPLIMFPERIAAVVKFYKNRMDRVLQYELTDKPIETISEGPERDRLEELNREIVGEAYTVDLYALGLAGDTLEEQDEEIDKIEQRVRQLRAEFDELFSKAPRINNNSN